jgi:methylase of polypeptide subunit release factors
VLAALLERFRQPLLVESFIPGREFAVSLLETENGLSMLPPLEWLTSPGDMAVLTEAFKQSYVPQDRQDAVRAGLSSALAADLERLSFRAFRALGLRDYARFDVRLSPGGTFYFLEANTTPSLEPQEALALSAKWDGMDYTALVDKMLAAALRRYGRIPSHEDRRMRIVLPAGPVDLAIPAGVHHPPPSTLELSGLLDVRKGDHVLDLGCGAGLLSIVAAKQGAKTVVATDTDPRALEATDLNASANGVAARIETRSGFWYKALGGYATGMFDVIAATPPQTPGPYAFGPRYGGPDGTMHLAEIIEGAAAFLNPASGRLWLLAISLANPLKLLSLLREHFHDVSVVRETERFFTSHEYEAIAAGLMRHFFELRAAGCADFSETGDGGYVFKNLFIRVRGVKAP